MECIKLIFSKLFHCYPNKYESVSTIDLDVFNPQNGDPHIINDGVLEQLSDPAHLENKSTTELKAILLVVKKNLTDRKERTNVMNELSEVIIELKEEQRDQRWELNYIQEQSDGLKNY